MTTNFIGLKKYTGSVAADDRVMREASAWHSEWFGFWIVTGDNPPEVLRPRYEYPIVEIWELAGAADRGAYDTCISSQTAESSSVLHCNAMNSKTSPCTSNLVWSTGQRVCS